MSCELLRSQQHFTKGLIEYIGVGEPVMVFDSTVTKPVEVDDLVGVQHFELIISNNFYRKLKSFILINQKIIFVISEVCTQNKLSFILV